MAKERTSHSYEIELKKMIRSRNGDCGIWLTPQIRATAANMVMIDKVQKELLETRKLITLTSGSMSQVKSEVNPLLPYYLKLLAELRLQYEALGLNYKTTPSKITEPTKTGVDETDPIVQFYQENVK